MGDLRKATDSNGDPYTTNDEKATACAHAIWTEEGPVLNPPPFLSMHPDSTGPQATIPVRLRGTAG
jgi:hypothetical protein